MLRVGELKQGIAGTDALAELHGSADHAGGSRGAQKNTALAGITGR